MLAYVWVQQGWPGLWVSVRWENGADQAEERAGMGMTGTPSDRGPGRWFWGWGGRKNSGNWHPG